MILSIHILVKTSPTGAAIILIIDGRTLHSLFNFNFGNQFFSLSDKIRKRRLTYQNFIITIFDEIRLVDSDMLFKLDIRLMKVKMDDKIFGSFSLFLFGDL